MSPLYLRSGKLLLKNTALATAKECCCGGCKYYFGNSILWGTGGLELLPGTPDLSQICLVVDGGAQTCGNETASRFSPAELANWLIDGGILAVKTEWPDGCGNSSQMTAFLSSIGSSITVGSSPIACTGGAGGYTANVIGLPVTQGISSVNSGGFAASINGGVEILNAPPCSSENRPGGPVLAGEMIGDGVVFVIGDSNLDPGGTSQIITNAVNIKKQGGSYF